MTPEQLSTVVRDALAAAVAAGEVALPDGPPAQVRIERPRSKEHGDYATNLAMQLARPAGMAPRPLAELLAARLRGVDGVARVDVAGPGFLNITLTASSQGALAGDIVAAGAAYGRSEAASGQRLNLEFVSANPTGPIHIGHVRWAAVGDALGRVLEAAGAAVTREYYFNDAGAQIDRFADSLLAAARGRPTPEDGYAGAYVDEIAAQVVARRPGVLALTEPDASAVFRVEGVDLMFDEIRQSLHEFGVDFDVYFNEKSLHDKGELDAALERLGDQGRTYEHGGACWLRTTDFGDDKDRVLRKSDGAWTYFAADLAYHPIANVDNPWLPGPDRDKETALASRRRIFDRAATDRIPVLGFHFPFPGLGRMLKTDGGYAWVPANWQF